MNQICAECKREFDARRGAKTCSNACRVEKNRRRKAGKDLPVAVQRVPYHVFEGSRSWSDAEHVYVEFDWQGFLIQVKTAKVACE
jgi:hypothetical protein